MDPIIARKNWRTMEPFHGFVYFAPEAAEEYSAIGVEGRSGYFGSRAAPMGAVSTEVVQATFFNFHPDLVRRAMDGLWERVTPSQMTEARTKAVDRVIRAKLGADASSAEMRRCADLLRIVADACDCAGRPLAAGHQSVERPAEPHLAAWRDLAVVREYRGDGHISLLTSEGISGVEALVLHFAMGEIPIEGLKGLRQWSDDEWDAAIAGLAERGLVDAGGSFTPEGAALRQSIEDRTDALATPPWAELGEDRCNELRASMRPFSKAVFS